MLTYILTIDETGADFRATCYPVGHVQVDGKRIIEARADVNGAVLALDNGSAWQAGADALAAAMPEPEGGSC